MAVLDWPEVLVPAKVTWGLVSNTESFSSPLNRSVQTVERPGARWKATWEFPPLTGEKLRMLEAFLASLNGMAGRFQVWPHHRPGQFKSPPVVASISGKSLQASVLNEPSLSVRAGDFLEIGGEMKMVTQDASDVNGLIDLRFTPAFRSLPKSGAEINLYRPRVTMMLASDEYSISVTPGRIAERVVFSGIEVF